MPIDERELRSRLAETAALAGPPRLTAEGLAARVRRVRRGRRLRAGIIAAVSVVAAAAAVAVPLALGGTSQPVISRPAPAPPALSYTVTVNGQTRPVPATGAAQLFTVTPGDRLTMTVEVTVPGPRAMTALWLGITSGVLSGHADMEPVLAASTRAPLRPGARRFVLHWTVPAGLAPGSSRQLSVEWEWRGPEPGNAQRDVAFSKAMTVVGRGNAIADNAAAADYLVLMKDDFAFRDSGPAPQSCAHAGPAGHYFTAVFDAATFVTLEAGLGNRPPQVSLQTLGPTLNLKQTS
jgi:hypothetical protein